MLAYSDTVDVRLRTVLDERCLNLSSRQSVSRNVDDIVDTASDPVVAFVVTTSAVAGGITRTSIGTGSTSCSETGP